MRVIAGIAKGRRLAVPPGDGVRPTADRVREALFSSLQPMLAGARVLDLFAGSGAQGIEALSRGAAHATFVEADRRTAEVVRANLATVGFEDRAEVVTSRALSWLRRGGTAPFDLALLDPPYALEQDDLTDVLAALVDHLSPGAEVVVERDRRADAPRWPAEMESTGERAYGSTCLHRARRLPDGDATG